MSDKFERAARELLAKHPEQQVVYSTGDGNLFFDYNDAQNYAMSIGAQLFEYRQASTETTSSTEETSAETTIDPVDAGQTVIETVDTGQADLVPDGPKPACLPGQTLKGKAQSAKTKNQ